MHIIEDGKKDKRIYNGRLVAKKKRNVECYKEGVLKDAR